jgi:hypothetical protein
LSVYLAIETLIHCANLMHDITLNASTWERLP